MGWGRREEWKLFPSLAWILRGLHRGFEFSGEGAKETEEKLCAIYFIIMVCIYKEAVNK